MRILAVDIGSTYTKLTAIDSEKKEILGTAQSFTTIETDVMDGFNDAYSQLVKTLQKSGCDGFEYEQLIACSSAAGGLKMVALGLVPDLTSKAARTAASNAGAKVMKTYAYEISKTEQEEIYNINPDLVLLCGGTNGGNKDVIIANAKRLCSINRNFTTIIAGNKSAEDEVVEVFKNAKKDFLLTENVMPEFNKLNIEPARNAIRDLFISRIISAKGLDKLQNKTKYKIIPTPLAVLQACELLSKGTQNEQGWGDLMAVDIGGATTDVYSMAKGEPTMDNTLTKGLPEPWSKRTVEGDLGMRYSLPHVFEQINSVTPTEESELQKIEKWVNKCFQNPDTLAKPETEDEKCEEFLGSTAISLAITRHCGSIEEVYTPVGLMYTLEGKDLMNTPALIGIGGILRNSRRPEEMLKGGLYSLRQPQYTKPKNPKLYLDSKYIYAAMGLLSVIDADLALHLLKKHTIELPATH